MAIGTRTKEDHPIGNQYMRASTHTPAPMTFDRSGMPVAILDAVWNAEPLGPSAIGNPLPNVHTYVFTTTGGGATCPGTSLPQ